MSASQLWYTFARAYLENLSADARMNEYFSCLSGIGPAKSNWISSFGSESVGSCVVVDFGIIGFKFSPILMHDVQFFVSVTFSL